MERRRVDLAVVGAGAAGLMAAIWAGRTGRCGSIVLLDGAARLGAKILIAGGGRCNVTHHAVDESAFAGSSRHAIKKVLRRYGVPETVEFFRELGVELKREETGKLFPTSDRARTVLDALLAAAGRAGAELIHPWRVEAIEPREEAFLLRGPAGELEARRIVLATGGKSLPKSGSDGAGFALAESLGHSVTPRLFPALVALHLASACFLTRLSGIAAPAAVEVRDGKGRRGVAFTGAVLCTHFGVSGPAILDVSRYYLQARFEDEAARLHLNWLPGESETSVDAALRDLKGSSPGRWLAGRLPERLARALCEEAGIDPATPGHGLTREGRRALAALCTAMPLPVVGDRGWNYAEVTAGGVPLAEIRLETMESRLRPGLHFCGEICDVDGRIGGFNFQWAWSSGYTVGVSVAPEAAPREA